MQGYHSALHCGVFRRNGGRESGSLLHFKHLTFLPINSQYKINIYIKSKNTTSLINQLYQKNGVFAILQAKDQLERIFYAIYTRQKFL